MSGIKLKIMVKACKIRMEAGEDLEDILASYPALSEEDKEQIRQQING